MIATKHTWKYTVNVNIQNFLYNFIFLFKKTILLLITKSTLLNVPM